MSGFLLDTNVIAELIRSNPDPKVTKWIDATNEELLFLSVLTLGEIRKGVVLLPRNARRSALEAWLSSDLPLRFSGRILDIDQEVADRWGQLSGIASARGAKVAVIDGLLAATASHHNLVLVTRNTKEVARQACPYSIPGRTEIREEVADANTRGRAEGNAVGRLPLPGRSMQLYQQMQSEALNCRPNFCPVSAHKASSNLR